MLSFNENIVPKHQNWAIITANSTGHRTSKIPSKPTISATESNKKTIDIYTTYNIYSTVHLHHDKKDKVTTAKMEN